MRFTINLADSVARSLEDDAKASGMPRSTLIAHYIAEHYERASLPDFEEQIFKLKSMHEDEMTFTKREYERQLTALQEKYDVDLQLCRDAGLELQQNQIGEIQQLRAEYEGKCEERCAAYEARITELAASTYELEIAHQKAEDNNQNLMAKLKAEGEDYQRALAEQEHRHQDVLDAKERRHNDITKALRHEQELTESKLQATQRELQLERDHNLELRNDKEKLQKQLELVTLRLPAPKEGFWARVWGRKKRSNSQEIGRSK
ncbi:MAG: hypothetical protein ACXVIG_04405 [Halobacteriota archaeon]